MSPATSQRPQWEIDRTLEGLTGRNVRALARAFSPLNPNNESTLSLIGTRTLFLTVSNLTLDIANVAGNNGTLNGAFSWTGSSLAAGSTVTLATNSVMTISNTSMIVINGMLTNAGTINWAGTANLLLVAAAGANIANLPGALFNAERTHSAGPPAMPRIWKSGPSLPAFIQPKN